MKTLKEILLSGGVNPWRARSMMPYVGRSTAEAGYGAVMQSREAMRVAMLKLMADHQLDAVVYATCVRERTRHQTPAAAGHDAVAGCGAA